jgi:hypothetical protein
LVDWNTKMENVRIRKLIFVFGIQLYFSVFAFESIISEAAISEDKTILSHLTVGSIAVSFELFYFKIVVRALASAK